MPDTDPRAAAIEAAARAIDENHGVTRSDAEAAVAAAVPHLTAGLRALHDPVTVYEYDYTNGVFCTDVNGEKVVLTRLCSECSSTEAIEAVEDCEWSEGFYRSVQWPCPTTEALDALERGESDA